MVLKQPLDLEYWFVQVFSGDITIFTFMGLLVITSLSAYFKMSGVTYAIFLTMFAVILKTMGANTLLVFIALLLSVILFWWTRRIVE